MNKKLLIIVFCSLCAQIGFAQKTQSISSPDGKIQTSISIGDKITYTVTSNNQTVIEASPISMTLNSGEVWGKNAKLDKSTKRIINQKITSPFYKRAQINDNCNELTLRFKKDWGIKFRVYNDGVAYRFINYRKMPFTVQNEEVKYNFANDCPATVPYVRLDGVSNYKEEHLEYLLSNCEIKPYINQLEVTPFCTRNTFIKYCQKNDIMISAHSVLTKGKMLNNDMLKMIAEKYRKSPAQILIKWSIQKNYIPLLKSENEKHIEDDFDTNFLISDEDMNNLDMLNENFVTHPKYL